MLKIGHRILTQRALSITACSEKVYHFSGDQVWWGIRKPGLDVSKNAGGRRTILRPRVDFWEDTMYGHGGDAKLWAGLKEDHDLFEKEALSEAAPVERTMPKRVLEVIYRKI
jgi:hypothetical protein